MLNHSYSSLKDLDGGKKTSNRSSAKYPKDKDECKSAQQRAAKQVKKQSSEGALLQRRYSEPGDVCNENATAGVKSPFLEDLRTALLSADIAPSKASDPRIQWFLEKYAAPGEREPLDDRYRECLARIRRRAAGKKIWASVDVTADPADGELVGNVVIGTLSPDGPGETFLLAAGALLHGGSADRSAADACDVGHAAARLFDDAMCLLWPDGVRHDDVLLLLQSAAWPRRADHTADSLAAVYANMVPVACPASALRAAAEHVCAVYPALDSLVANVTRAFSAASPALYCRLRARAPGVPPPPPPPSTATGHWATAWIDAVRYLSENFRAVRDALTDETDPGPAAVARQLAGDPTAEAGLAFVDANYGFLPAAIARVEARGARLRDTVAEVFRAADRLADVAGDLGAAVHRRFADALRENRGLRALAGVADVAAVTTQYGPPEKRPGANDLAYLRYAPVAAVDVRAAFPRYRAALLADRGKCAVHKTLVVQCNDFSSSGGP